MFWSFDVSRFRSNIKIPLHYKTINLPVIRDRYIKKKYETNLTPSGPTCKSLRRGVTRRRFIALLFNVEILVRRYGGITFVSHVDVIL